jgi:uncharacterized membrane protein
MAVSGGSPAYSPRPQLRFDAIGEAWRLFQQQMSTWIVAEIVFMIGIALAYLVAILLFGLTATIFSGISKAIPIAVLAIPLSFFVPITVIVVGVQLGLAGMYRMAIKQMQGEQIAVGDLFSVTDVIGPLLVGSLLSALAISIGNIFCGIPGLIAAGLLMFTIPLIVDKRMQGIDAMKLSFETLKPDLVMATLFYVVVAVVGEIGMVGCGIGILFTLPLFFLSIAIAYRDFFIGPSISTSPYAPPPTAAAGEPPPPPPPAPEPVAESAPAPPSTTPETEVPETPPDEPVKE